MRDARRSLAFFELFCGNAIVGGDFRCWRESGKAAEEMPGGNITKLGKNLKDNSTSIDLANNFEAPKCRGIRCKTAKSLCWTEGGGGNFVSRKLQRDSRCAHPFTF